MSKNLKSTEGDTYRILSVVAEHTLISKVRLGKFCSASFPTDNLYEATLKSLISSNLCKSVGKDSVRVLPAGHHWLEKNEAAAQVEAEDTSSEDMPSKPYDAAKLKMESRHLSVFQALRKIDKKEIDLHPDFQRAFVWDTKKQSRLIESALIRIPLPAFYIDATDQVKWSVVDGLQRLTTLHRFCNEKSLKLTGLQFLPRLNGCSFDDLPTAYQVLLEDDTSLVFYNLLPGTPVAAKFTIFSRVNTGGMQLTPQEIRHALSPGPARKWLAVLAATGAFQKATTGAVESLRMSDRELVLRGLAFLAFGVEAYKEFGELDGFLLHALKEFNNYPEDERKQLESKLISSLEKVHDIFDRYSFRKFYEHFGRRGPLNKALFEVWIKGVEPYTKQQLLIRKDKISEGFMALLLKDDEFVKSISASTGGNKAVQTRFDKIEQLLREATNDCST